MSIKEELENLNSMIKSMDEQMQLLEEITNSNITNNFGLDIGIKDIICDLTIDDIENMTEESLTVYLNKISLNDGENKNLENMKNNYKNDSEYADKDFIEYAKYVFKDIKSTIENYNDLASQREKLLAEVDKVSQNWFDYINSKEYKEKKLNKLNELKKRSDEETDPVKKSEILRMIHSMEYSESLEFLFERIEKLGEKEVNNIKNIFFDNSRSSLIMKRFSDKLPRYGYSKDIYKMFFNIEEKFLPEEYNDFNNIFLFNVMRFVSYTKPYDKTDAAFTSAILIKLYNLLYHKFDSQETENQFIELIKRFDDYFMPYKEYFTKYNITSPKHPARIQKDKEYEEKRRVMVIASLQNEGIDVDTSLSTEELRNMLQDVIDKKSNTKEIEFSSINDDGPIKFDKNIFSDFSDDKSSEEVLNELKVADSEKNLDESQSADSEEVLNELEGIDSVELSSDNTEIGEIIPEHSIEQSQNNTVKYVDRYNYYYIKNSNGTYDYYDNNNEIYEQNISEDDILRLLSVNALKEETV